MQGARNMAMMAVLVLVTALGGAMVAGCSVAEKAADNPEIAQLVVQNRTLSFIDGDRERAELVERGASRVFKALERDRVERVSELERMAEEEIPWEDLEPEEAQNLRNLISVIQLGFERYAEGDERISEDQKVALRTLMLHVMESAELVP